MIALFLSASAQAAEAPSFPQLLRDAEISSPRLIEAAANVAAAQGRAQQSAAWPNPQAGVELEDFAGGGAYHGTSRAQATVSLSEPLELGGQRSARIAAGHAALTAEQARGVQLRAEFGYDLAIAYANAEVAQSRIRLLTEDLDRAKEDLRSARALVQAGREGELRAVQTEAAASAAAAELEAARADAIGAFARLSGLAGASEPFSAIQGSLLDIAARNPRTAPPIVADVNAPSIVTAEAEREVADRELTVERKRAIPTPSVSIGARKLRGDDATVWVAGISFPLPVFDRNRGDIAAARAELTAAEARLSAAKLAAAGEWRAASAQADAAISRHSAAEQGQASAREAYRLARIGYDAGRTPLFELLSTRRALTEAELRLLDARLARVNAEASLARLAGRIPFVE